MAPARENPTTFSTLLREHRLAASLTQAALAERAGISERAVQYLEEGLGQPQRATTRRLAEAFALCAEEQAQFEAAAQPGPRRRDQLARGRASSSGPQSRWQANVEESLRHVAGSTPWALPACKLPAELSSFIGREEELAQLSRRLATTRLLTLVGPGGVGKTRLAVAMADARRATYEDGVVFVDLAPLRDPRLVPATIGRSLNVRESEGRGASEPLLAYLRDRKLLLVLDNFEHLLDATSQLSNLLQTCPRVTLLITSRTALRIRGEQRFVVQPLATPATEATITDQDIIAWPAVRLFVERAQAVAAEFELDTSNASTIASICRRLDGLPLAIELAAARVPLLPPPALLRRLDRSLSLLTGGAPDLPERQHTLRAALAWSYDLLVAGDQLLFQRLAVFAGGWTIEAAEAVCTDSDLPAHQVLDRVHSLVEHSLLRRQHPSGDEPRFDMLETIREYAAEQLEASAQTSTLRERHLAWCLAYAESAESELRGPQQQHVLARLELEHENMRAALSWSFLRSPTDALGTEAALRLGGALARFWSARGFIGEGCTWLERAVTADDRVSPPSDSPGPSAVRARALLGLGWLFAARGEFERGLAYDEASLAMYRQLGDRRGQAAPLLAMAHLADYQGNSSRVRVLLLESIEHARAVGDDNQVGEALCWLARSLYHSGEVASARAALEESAALLRRTGDIARLAGALYIQGEIETEQGHHTAASDVLARCRDLYRQAGDRVGETKAIGWLGYASLHAGDHVAARQHFSDAVERGRHDGLNEVPTWLCLLAMLERAEGRPDAASAHAHRSLVLFQRMGCPIPAVRALEVASGLLAATGTAPNVELAARLLGAAELKRKSSGVPLPPAERADYERNVQMVSTQLPHDVMSRAWRQGQTMNLERAISEVLDRSDAWRCRAFELDPGPAIWI